jgi:hypothetical protein
MRADWRSSAPTTAPAQYMHFPNEAARSASDMLLFCNTQAAVHVADCQRRTKTHKDTDNFLSGDRANN